MLEQEVGILEEMVTKSLTVLRAASVAAHHTASDSQATAQPERVAAGECPPPADLDDESFSADAGMTRSGTDDAQKNKDKGKKSASTIRVEHAKLDHLMNLIGELIINRNRFAMLAKALKPGKMPIPLPCT